MCKRCWCWSRILQTLPVPSPCGARLICLPPSAVLTMLSTVRRVDPPPPQHRSPLLPLLQVGGSSLRDYSISTFIWILFKGSEFTDPFLWSIEWSLSFPFRENDSYDKFVSRHQRYAMIMNHGRIHASLFSYMYMLRFCLYFLQIIVLAYPCTLLNSVNKYMYNIYQ